MRLLAGRALPGCLMAAWAVMAVACGGCGTGGSKSSGDVPGRGERGYLRPGPAKEILVAADEKALEEMLAFGEAGNEAALRQMIRQGRLLPCGRWVEVSVVEPGFSSTTVRIMGGEHDGRTGVVPNEWLRK